MKIVTMNSNNNNNKNNNSSKLLTNEQILMDKFSNQIWFRIISFLDSFSLCQIMQTNKKMYRMLRSPSIWNTQMKKQNLIDFRILSESQIVLDSYSIFCEKMKTMKSQKEGKVFDLVEYKHLEFNDRFFIAESLNSGDVGKTINNNSLLLKKPIIIEFGAFKTKIGFAGDPKPSFVFHSMIGFMGPFVSIGNDEKKKYWIGDEAYQNKQHAYNNRDWEFNKSPNMTQMKRFVKQGSFDCSYYLDEIFEFIAKKLNVKFSEHPSVLICDSFMNENWLSQSTRFAGSFYSYSPFVGIILKEKALHNVLEKPNGIVISIGHDHSFVIPFIDGKPISSAVKTEVFGGMHINLYLLQLLKTKIADLDRCKNEDELEDIKVKLAECSILSKKELEMKSKMELKLNKIVRIPKKQQKTKNENEKTETNQNKQENKETNENEEENKFILEKNVGLCDLIKDENKLEKTLFSLFPKEILSIVEHLTSIYSVQVNYIYERETGDEFTIGIERFECCEVLFHPFQTLEISIKQNWDEQKNKWEEYEKNEEESNKGIIDLFFDSLMSLENPKDRQKVLDNIVLDGRTSLIPGLATRIKKEIQMRLTDENEKEQVKVIVNEKTGFLSWFGASMLASKEEWLSKNLVSSSEFNNSGFNQYNSSTFDKNPFIGKF
jgi:actin-related protein